MMLDDIDKHILNLLQDDATLPLKSIAQRLDVAPSTVQRRIQHLNEQKIISRQVAIIDPIKVGYHITVLVMVKMLRPGNEQQRFERLMNQCAQVMSCYEVSGDYDFVLMVNSQSMQDYHNFTRRLLTGENNVAHFNSQFVMNFVKSGTKIELA